VIGRFRAWWLQRKTRRAITKGLIPCRNGTCTIHECKKCHDFGLLYDEIPYPLERVHLGSCTACAKGRHMDCLDERREKGLIDFPVGCGQCRYGIIRSRKGLNPLWDQICTCDGGMWLRGSLSNVQVGPD